jgi:hypothetical protein
MHPASLHHCFILHHSTADPSYITPPPLQPVTSPTTGNEPTFYLVMENTKPAESETAVTNYSPRKAGVSKVGQHRERANILSCDGKH